MKALDLDLFMYENSKLEFQIEVTDEDCNPITLTAYGAKMQIREGPDEPVILEADDDGGQITFTGTSSNIVKVVINQPAIIAVKQTLRNAKELWYDLVIFPATADEDNLPQNIARGRIIYHQWITQLDV